MAKVTPSVMLDEMSGKAGSVVYVKTKQGTIVRPRRTPANPNTPAQEAVRDNLRRAARGYEALTPAQAQTWEDYGQTITKTQPITGETYNPTGIAIYVALVSKLLQVTPTAALPTAPPTSDFVGDRLTITVTPSAGRLTFSASSPNSLGTRTELLVQRLRSRNRTPQAKKYLSRGFATFATGSLSAEVTVTPGVYACAIRYVNANTGQQTEIVPLTVQTVSLALEKTGTAKKAA